MKTIDNTSIGAALNAVREAKPLVHHLTNYVTVNDCANVTLAIGASPVMADDIGEAADIAAIASALVINVGTLNERTIASMLAAGKSANAHGVPVVLDPVGAGASALRNRTIETLLDEVKPDILRGNLSEIKCIAGLGGAARGVDAAESDLAGDLTEESAGIAKALAARLSCTVAVTGAVDVVSDGTRTVCIQNGHPMLSKVTGTGCMSTSLCASFAGANKDLLLAAVGGIAAMGIAGEIAYERAGKIGTGSFHIALIDAISLLNADTISEKVHVYEA